MDAQSLQEFSTDMLRALGAPAETADRVARSLVNADSQGCSTHGTSLLPLYATMIAAGELDPLAQAEAVAFEGAVATVDGRNGFGQLAGMLAVKTGVGMARDAGVAAVGVRNAGHLGRLGEWARMATSEGMVFMAFCNSGGGARNVAPFGGDRRVLSTNPVAFGVPARGALGHDVVVDFATSQVSGSVIREHYLAGKKLHPEWATAQGGEPLADARDFIQGRGALLPLGGRVTGHKGYALAIVAEVLAGIAGGLMIGEYDREWFSNAALFILVDPGRFIPQDEIEARIAGLATYLRQAGARLPGAGAHQSEEASLRQGLMLPDHVCGALKRLAAELQLAIPAELPEIANAAVGASAAKTW